MTGIGVRIALVYAIGFGAVAFGFYQFWRDGTVSQHPFVIGGICILTAAAIDVILDIWHRVRGWRRHHRAPEPRGRKR